MISPPACVMAVVNEGRRAGAGERIGDLKGRLLAAAGVEARHDLQYGHFGHALDFVGFRWST